MKPNPKKFQFKILGKASGISVILNKIYIEIRESRKVILLGLKIDNSLTFKGHTAILCCNASYKLHALQRIRKCRTPDKAKLFYNASKKNNHVTYVMDLFLPSTRTCLL